MKRELIGSLAWGAGMIALALAATFVRKLGYIDETATRRLVSCAIGLWLAWYGNGMPKALVPNACARQARRVTAWTMVLSGLVYAALWAFAPIQLATTAGTGAVLAGVAVSLGYCLSLRARASAA
ncbi:ammonium transporter [Caulobacter sp. KR2-114]|uniref:ammonium transporter n=1 Tax=Caulobacter sp. KR2-114 TaxID=3400912 RepID=UPI003C0E53BD